MTIFSPLIILLILVTIIRSESEWEIGRSPTVSLLHILCASLKIRIRSSQPATRHRNGWVLVLAYSSETRGWESWSSQIWSHPLPLPPRRTIPRISNNLKYCEKSPHIGQWGIFKYFGQYFDLSLTCSVEAQLQSHFPTESFPFLHCVSFRGLAMVGLGKRRCYMDVFRRGALCRRGFWFWKQDKNCARRSTCPCSQKQISQTYVNIIYAYCTDMCTCTWLLVTMSYW